MLKKLTFLLSLAGGICVAQQKNAAVIVVGRVLNAEDSIQLRESFFSGLKSKLSNKTTESESYFKQVVELDPANDAALYELACLYHAQGEDNIAEKYARNAVTVKSQNKWYWLLLAEIYKRTQNYDQLTLVYTDLIHLEPNSENYYYDKANSLFLANKTKDAEALYNDIEKRFGTSNELINARQRIYQKDGSPDKAAAELEKLITANPGDIRSYLALSELYEKSAELNKALQVLLKAQAAGLSSPYLNLSLADIYNNQGKKEESIKELKTAFGSNELAIDAKIGILLSLLPRFKDNDLHTEVLTLAKVITENHPENAKAFSVFGDILIQDGKLKEARQAFTKAIELDNQNYHVWEQSIRISFSINDYQTVIKDGEEAISLFPNQAVLYLYTALSYAQTAKHEKAINYLQTALSLETEDKAFQSQAYSSLGDSFNALHKYKESDEAYDKALELNPQNTYVLNNYAYYLSLRGVNLSKAAEMSAKSNELQPDNASFQDTYAWVLYKQKKYTEARIWIEKAIKTTNKSGVLAEHYGDILYYLGEKELAIEQWKIAKEKGLKSEVLERKINEKKVID